jgi:hypothetical protein
MRGILGWIWYAAVVLALVAMTGVLVFLLHHQLFS